MTKNFITFHIVNDIPWSNLNRDDSGTPKRTILGGVERGMLSSQSIKRAIRKDYEKRILELQPDLSVKIPAESLGRISKNASIRSRYTAEWVRRRVEELATSAGIQVDSKKTLAKANQILKKLTGGEETIVWFSVEELETLAKVVFEEITESSSVNEKDILDTFLLDKASGSLAIAAFGRMFASATNKNTEAAVAVSPAISTHANLIETDYFIAGDDFGFFKKKGKEGIVENFDGSGAAHLGIALYTSGVFYRTVTIDVDELIRNWSGIYGDFAYQALSQLITSIINALPTGKKNSTAPYTSIPLVIAEDQSYREAYSIETPVLVGEEGGFLESSIREIAAQHSKVRRYNALNYGEALVSGSLASLVTDAPVTMEKLVEKVVTSILERAEEKKVMVETELEEMNEPLLGEDLSSEAITLFQSFEEE